MSRNGRRGGGAEYDLDLQRLVYDAHRQRGRADRPQVRAFAGRVLLGDLVQRIQRRAEQLGVNLKTRQYPPTLVYLGRELVTECLAPNMELTVLQSGEPYRVHGPEYIDPALLALHPRAKTTVPCPVHASTALRIDKDGTGPRLGVLLHMRTDWSAVISLKREASTFWRLSHVSRVERPPLRVGLGTISPNEVPLPFAEAFIEEVLSEPLSFGPISVVQVASDPAIRVY